MNVKVNTANGPMLVADLNKEGLRAACKHNGVTGYGKMNNDQMRKALINAQPVPDVEVVHTPVVSETPVVVEAQNEVKSEPAQAPQEETTAAVAPTVRTVTTGTVVAPKSLKIEKGREKQNGVTRPSAGSICRAIWDTLDARRAELKVIPSFENVRDLMKANNWSKNTAFTQFQRWKQFNGVMPRSAEGQDEAEVAAPAVQDESTDLHDDSNESEGE